MAQTYTRQSTFADGDTITAALFNDEYNQLVNAFAYSSSSASSTGHRHDGTAGQGGNIHTIGDLDFLNKIVVDSTNNRWGFYVEVSSAAVEQIRLQDGALLPVTDSDVDLGTSSLYFKDAYIDSITTTGNVAVGGNLTVTGTTTFNGGTITMGDAATDNVVFGADVDSSIIPDDDDTYDLGSSSQQWRNIFIDGTAEIDTLALDGTTVTSTAAELNILDGVTSTTAELNILDGVTSTTAELNILDGVTATATELNLLDGVTSTTAELNILDGVTSTAAELNILDGVTSTTAELNILDGVTSTTAELNILDGVTATAAELNLLDGVTATTAELNILDGVTASATDINLIDGITNGTVIASKAIITDANKDISGGRNITITGELDAATLDISGDADIDGTLEADAITIGGVTLAETISDTVGAMVTSNTETGIAVTYDDSDNTLDFVIGTLNQDTTGNAATATALETARTIHGVSFDGTANIDLSEVIQDTVGAMVSSNTESGITVAYQDADGTLDFTVGTLNQDTTGNAATATALETARTIHGVSFDGTANIDLTEVVQDTVGAMFSSNTESGITVDYQDADGTIDLTVGTLNQNTTGNAATATALETARTIHGVSFDGTANIDLTEVVQDTVGAMFSSNTETGITATYQDSDGTIDLTVSGAAVTSVADADADTKIQVEESSDEDKIRFDTGGTERMIIDSTGVGVGTSSPASKLHIKVGTNNNLEIEEASGDLRLLAINDARDANVPMEFAASKFDFLTGAVQVGFSAVANLQINNNSDVIEIKAKKDGTDDVDLAFLTQASGGTLAEKMRIMSGGDVAIGSTTADPLSLAFTGTGLTLNENSGTAFMQIDGGNGSRIDFGISGSRNTTIYADANGAEISRTTNHPIKFKTNNSERMRIDGSGNVGIGNTSPAGKLHVQKDASETDLVVRSNTGGTGSTIGGRLRLQLGAQSNSGSGNADTQAGDTLGQIMFEGQGTDYSYQGGNIMCKVQTGDGDDNRSNQGTFMSFETLNVGSVSPAEAMRINQSGGLLVGKTADNLTDSGFTLKKRTGSDHAQLTCVGAGSTSVETYYVYDNANSEFEFFVNYAGAVYYRSLVSLSDERKKDNIQNITLGLDAVKELRPVSFDWKNDKGNDQLGFIAQEVETTSLKQLVSTYKDENIEDCKSLNKEQMIPVLVKAIQEQQEQIEALQSEINTLKGGE